MIQRDLIREKGRMTMSELAFISTATHNGNADRSFGRHLYQAAKMGSVLCCVAVLTYLLPDVALAVNECTAADKISNGKPNASAFTSDGELKVTCPPQTDNYPNGIIYRIERISGVSHTDDGFNIELKTDDGTTITNANEDGKGISVQSIGRLPGVITVENQADITTKGNSIQVTSESGIKLTNTGELNSGQSFGILARNRNSGEIHIEHSGSIVGTKEAGIYAWYTGNTSSTDANVKNRIVIRSSGDITVQNDEKTGRHGILVHGNNSKQIITADLHITGGTIRSDDDGIRVSLEGPKASAGDGSGTVKVVVDKGVKIISNTEDGIHVSAKFEGAESKDLIYIKSDADITSTGMGIYGEHFGSSSEGSITIISGGNIRTTGSVRRNTKDKEYEYTNFRGLSAQDRANAAKVNSHGIYAYAPHTSGTIPIKIDMTGGSITSTGDGIHVRNEGNGLSEVRVRDGATIDAQGFGIRIIGKSRVTIDSGARVSGVLGAVSVNGISSAGFLTLPSLLLNATSRLPLLSQKREGAYASLNTRSGSTDASGIAYRYRNIDLTVGYAKEVSPEMLIGASVQHLPVKATLPAGETLKGKGLGLALALNYSRSDFYLEGQLAFTRFKSNYHRGNAGAESGIKATQVHTELETGCRYDINERWELTPRFNYRYVKVKTKSFAGNNSVTFPNVSESALGFGATAATALKTEVDGDMKAYASLDIEQRSPSNGGNYRFTDADSNDVTFETTDSGKRTMLKAQVGVTWNFGKEGKNLFGAHLGYADRISGVEADETTAGLNLELKF